MRKGKDTGERGNGERIKGKEKGEGERERRQGKGGMKGGGKEER